MMTILLVKFVLNIVYEVSGADFTASAGKTEFYINISIEIVFNLLLIYYQVQFNEQEQIEEEDTEQKINGSVVQQSHLT